MATPPKRPNYFSFSEQDAFDPRLEDKHLATLVRLRAFLNRRRWRDALTAEEGERALLGASDLAVITRRRQHKHALNLLRDLAERSELLVSVRAESVSVRGELVEIYWPNLAESLWSHSRNRAVQGTPKSENENKKSSKSRDRARTGQEGEEPGSGAIDGAEWDRMAGELEALAALGSEVPERLSREDREAFGAWLHRNLAPMWPHRARLERECLAHYRRHPDRAVKIRSWLAACEGYAKRAWERERAQPGLWPTPVTRGRG